ncbi:hypothetical protein JOB18_018925 [Solea senegalensis]|uniref:Uncharacterized protein n=1 Tax=Solea senegalensis TaxID=28829 RepID=A0AAV6STJ3_SOLSE|nr:hypothetical protein JOB18_018925 [Solea senegalensis]
MPLPITAVSWTWMTQPDCRISQSKHTALHDSRSAVCRAPRVTCRSTDCNKTSDRRSECAMHQDA